MGRRSLATERRQQIITAAIQCMAANGVSGTTLERIADTAGMARGHVRHFAGNRDELITDSARVFFFGDGAESEKNLGVLAATSPMVDPEQDVTGVLDYLFGEFAAPNDDNPAAFAFMDAGRTMPHVHAIVTAAYSGIQKSLQTALHREYPQTTSEQCARTAYAVFALAFGNTLLTDIEPSDQQSANARSVAEEIIATLAA